MKELFKGIVDGLNRKGVCPIIYGSLGLSFVLARILEINDIDFIIEKPSDFAVCKEVLNSMGFSIDSDHEREFIRGGFYVSFLDKEAVEKLIGESLELSKNDIDGRIFYNISLPQYLKIYEEGIKGEYRKNKKEDLSKIVLIKSCLNKSK